MKKSLLHIEESLKINMCIEEFENWKNNHLSRRNFTFHSLIYNWVQKTKPFFGELEGENLNLRSTNRFLKYPKSRLNLTSLETDKTVVLKTEIPNCWLIYVFDLVLLIIIGFLTILPEWARSKFSEEPFQLFSTSTVVPFMGVLVMIVFRTLFLKFSIKILHQKVKKSLLIKKNN